MMSGIGWKIDDVPLSEREASVGLLRRFNHILSYGQCAFSLGERHLITHRF
ncbi:MAG: hypothetical protein LBR75_02530 [Prevotellaceae bacterium]|nr:hypothetical protein [Prevotellaceae bacterium]